MVRDELMFQYIEHQIFILEELDSHTVITVFSSKLVNHLQGLFINVHRGYLSFVDCRHNQNESFHIIHNLNHLFDVLFSDPCPFKIIKDSDGSAGLSVVRVQRIEDMPFNNTTVTSIDILLESHEFVILIDSVASLLDDFEDDFIHVELLLRHRLIFLVLHL